MFQIVRRQSDHGLSGHTPRLPRGGPDGTIGLFSGVLRLTTGVRRRPSLELVSTAAMILRAQEKERARVARELHDDTGQALTLLLVRLQLLADQITDPKTRAELAELRALVAQTMDGVRRLVVDLGPTVLDDLGLASSVEWLAERMRGDGRMRVDLRLDVDREPSRPTALAIFRVTQEALTNVLRHASASCVSVRLTNDAGHLKLVIADDGAGFDVEAAERRSEESVGLLGMTERIALVGGQLSIESKPGHGTTVVALVPFANEGA
jgi:signal transduction histidine kinase